MAGDIKGTRDVGEKKGELMLHGRAELCVSGIFEVINFDEQSVRLKSVDGELCIEGEELKIGALDTDKGTVSMCGRINGIYYATDPEERKKGFWGRLVR